MPLGYCPGRRSLARQSSQNTCRCVVIQLVLLSRGQDVEQLNTYIMRHYIISGMLWLGTVTVSAQEHVVLAHADSVRHISEVVVSSRMSMRQTIPSATLKGEELRSPFPSLKSCFQRDEFSIEHIVNVPSGVFLSPVFVLFPIVLAYSYRALK